MPDNALTYICTIESFQPISTPGVRWLAPQADYYRYEQMLLTRGADPLSYGAWLDLHAQGYGFAAFVEQGTVLSMGVVLRQPSGDWELAGVRTLEEHSDKGYATAVSSFITNYILNERGRSESKLPADNPAMRQILQNLGYRAIIESDSAAETG